MRRQGQTAAGTLTVAGMLEAGTRRLAHVAGDSAHREAAYLLSGLLGLSPGQLRLRKGDRADAAVGREFEDRIERRLRGEPLQYIEGYAAFRELRLRVDTSVLIPRPETEVLVGEVLDWAAGKSALSFLDIGAGSGAISLSLLTEGPFASGVAVDISADALKVADHNARNSGVTTGARADHHDAPRLDLRLGSFYGPVGSEERFDVIVSNPPYVASGERESLPAEVRDWEPPEALFSGPSGREAIERIVAGAPDHLRAGGLLALEVAVEAADSTARALEAQGGWRETTVARDLAGRTRFVLSERAGRGD